MRHRKAGPHLGRTSAHRKAMFRNLVTSLLEHERVQTTDAKAKELRRVAERMITLGKRGSLHDRRRALRVIRSREVTAKVFDDLAERYRGRPGGYTRVLKVGHRVGDAAAISLVELVEPMEASAEEEKPKKKAARKKTSSRKTQQAKAESEAESKRRTRKRTAKKKSD